MCIILFKPKRISMPVTEILENCFENNPNGAGFMYRDGRSRQIQIHKGYMTLESLQAALNEVDEKVNLKRTDVVIHFRISTTGSVIPENTHPFPISNNIKELKALNIITGRALAHNGVLSDYADFHNQKSDMSDTMYFCKMLSGVNDRFVKTIISKHATGSRFVYLSSKHTITWGMDKCIDKVGKGLFFSNGTYRKLPKYIEPDYNFGGGWWNQHRQNGVHYYNSGVTSSTNVKEDINLLEDKEAEWQKRVQQWKTEHAEHSSNDKPKTAPAKELTLEESVPQSACYITDDFGTWLRTTHPTHSDKTYYRKLSTSEQLAYDKNNTQLKNHKYFHDGVINYTDYQHNRRILNHTPDTQAEQEQILELVEEDLAARKQRHEQKGFRKYLDNDYTTYWGFD